MKMVKEFSQAASNKLGADRLLYSEKTRHN